MIVFTVHIHCRRPIPIKKQKHVASIGMYKSQHDTLITMLKFISSARGFEQQQQFFYEIISD